MHVIQHPSEAARHAAAIVRRHLPDPSYRVFLFGSRATATAHARSDIDIGIEGPAAVPAAVLAAIEDELDEAPTLYTVEIVDFARVSDGVPAGGARAHPAVTKPRSLRADFERAVARLAEVLALPHGEIIRDSAIQRFQISFELCVEISEVVSRRRAQRGLYLAALLFPRCLHAWRDCTRSVLDRADGIAKPYRAILTTNSWPMHVYGRLPQVLQRFQALLSATRRTAKHSARRYAALCFLSRYFCSPVSTSSFFWLCTATATVTMPVVRCGVSAAIVRLG